MTVSRGAHSRGPSAPVIAVNTRSPPDADLTVVVVPEVQKLPSPQSSPSSHTTGAPESGFPKPSSADNVNVALGLLLVAR